MKSPGVTEVIVSDSDDGPEEGEIVDDDLEDISDNSIIFTPCIGKSLSRRDNLQALSLSSITDLDETLQDKPRKRRKSFRRKEPKQPHKRRKSKRKTADSDSSDDDLDLNSRLKLQLKAAVHVDIKESHQNSLRTRLRAMVKNDGEPEILSDTKLDVNGEQIQDDQALSSEEPQITEDNEIDDELIQLRLEALQTAIVNKYKDRKRKIQANGLPDEMNKENTNNNVEENCQNIVLNTENKVEGLQISPESSKTSENSVPPPEEDEDVLRALLLASMSKKITKNVEPLISNPLPVSTVITKPIMAKQNIVLNNHLRNMNNINTFRLNNIKKVNKAAVNKLVKMPTVKPLIINVNSDSESDFDLSSSPEKSIKNDNINQVTVNNVIESTVERFLKEQRAKVEAETKKIDILTSGNIITTKSAISPISAAPIKVIHNRNQTKPNKPPLALEKSTLKWLPENKQAEYQKLQTLLKQKRAELRKPRVRKLSQRPSSDKDISNVKNGFVPKIGAPVLVKPRVIKAKIIANKSMINGATKAELIRNQEKRLDAALLHNTLKEMQVRKDGRLQIQEKYRMLRPLVKKINDVSKEQKQWDLEVKRLLEELANARKRQQKAHEDISASVKELVEKKQKIDQSVTKVVEQNSFKPITSTPIKPKRSLTPLDLSAVSMTSNGSDHIKNPEQINRLTNPSQIKLDSEMSTTVCGVKRVISDTDLNVGDPNDIDRIIRKSAETAAIFEKGENMACRKSEKVRYVSPLDCVKRKEVVDPFSIMCPFEVDGTCKDADCTYNHFLPK